MVRVAWPLFAAGLVILGVHYLPWPVRSQSQDTYRANSSPSVTLTSASAGGGTASPTEDPAPPAPKVQTKSQPLPVLEPESEFAPPAPLPSAGLPPAPPAPSKPRHSGNGSQPKPETPSAGLPSWEDTLEKVEKKVNDSLKAVTPTAAQTPGSPPLPIPGAPIPPPVITDVPPAGIAPPTDNVPPPAPKDVPPSPFNVPGNGPVPPIPAPATGLPAPVPAPKTAEKPFYPDPTVGAGIGAAAGGSTGAAIGHVEDKGEAAPHKTPKVTVSGHPSAQPSGKPITSPWTFHLEIIDGKNVITAKVGKTVQFKVNCDKVDIQSPFGTIQAQGNVKVSSLGLEVMGEKMTIQLQEDSMVLEGKAQMKCQRDGQEIDLRSDRFSLRLSEIQGQTTSSTSQSPQVLQATQVLPLAPQASPVPLPIQVPAAPPASRPPIVDVSRDFP